MRAAVVAWLLGVVFAVTRSSVRGGAWDATERLEYTHGRSHTATRPSLPVCFKELAPFALLPTDPLFANATQIQQPLLRAADQPAFVALPTSELEVELALACATRHELQVTIKSGGHSFGAYSRVPAPGFVISLARMTAVHLHEETHQVRVSGGAHWADVYEAFSHSNNTYQVVGGLCPTVGVIGYSSGGGVGPLARLHGMAADNVLSFRLTLANGSRSVDVSPVAHPDLFWAVRGSGGGQFGVVTSLTFQAHPGVPMYTWGTLVYADRTTDILDRLAKYADSRPRWLNVDGELDGQGALTLWVFAAQPQEVAMRALSPFLDDLILEIVKDDFGASATAANPKVVVTLQENDCFWEAIQAFAIAKGYSAYSSSPFLLRSVLVPGSMSPELVAAITRWDASADPSASLCGQSLIQFGGRIADLENDATAFPWRTSSYMLYASCAFNASRETGAPDSRAAVFRLLDEWSAAIVPLTQGAYVNFIDPTLPNWQTAYFGSNLPRLLAVKKNWNPPGIGPLRFKQEIGS